MNKITPCLWFNYQAEEASSFYISLFKESKIGNITYYGKSGAHISGQNEGSVMTVEFELNGQKFTALNGGPIFKFTPAVSLKIWCNTENEINQLWNKLSQEGSVLWELKEYPWASKYGWCEDKFGVSWQVMIGESPQKITPVILFNDQNFGKGKEAINFYTTQFENSNIDEIKLDNKNEIVLYSTFNLEGSKFVIMEGQASMKHEITHGISFVINCNTQDEIDQYWKKLSVGGTIEECGWLKDKFGVSWQVVPTILNELIGDSNSQKTENVMKAMLQMKKLDIEKLKQSYLQPTNET